MVSGADVNLDAVDLALLDAMNKHPRAGALELSRQVKVARATVQARLKRMEDAGVIAGYAPHVNLAAAGFGVQAFVTLQIAQGALDTVTAELEAIPGVLEAFATTGSGDVLCRIAAASHEDLQATLLELNRSGIATRSTSVMVLSVVVPLRSMPLLQTLQSRHATKAPAYRRDGQSR
ncbi:Lrp/AsnC family transcriptional regulator [Rhodococcus erythropolis]|uniref:Lrp/AsnC family transcriptional regulator n=1 Tax=Rhodococcus erythropolis TaxID=1833 RepID=UPI001BE52A72|nr:Lrp/AsnC family transcriptional regulator [Rhodococcus erythropolis]MBT2265300.1 Lrp/AsnC family transcriptional regulator [Rhodococcus erythropolis]